MDFAPIICVFKKFNGNLGSTCAQTPLGCQHAQFHKSHKLTTPWSTVFCVIEFAWNHLRNKPADVQPQRASPHAVQTSQGATLPSHNQKSVRNDGHGISILLEITSALPRNHTEEINCISFLPYNDGPKPFPWQSASAHASLTRVIE